MEYFHEVRIGEAGAGLTNQLGFLISGIMLGRGYGKRFIVVDQFNKDYSTKSPCPISDIINLNFLNYSIKDLGVTVVDKQKLSISIISIQYGIGGAWIDITKK